MNQVALLHKDTIRPSTYNPRQADPRRLELVALSLRKLGFLLPVYADENGEILSGHQRHYVATEMLGATQLPVAHTRAMSLDERKAVNIVFNRGTNDLHGADTPQDLTSALEAIDLDALAAAVPDKQPDTPAFYPILRAQDEPIGPIIEANRGKWLDYARNITRTLKNKGVVMPIVVTPDNVVVNGIGRLQLAAERGDQLISVVRVSEAEGALAKAMLNLLSMDFDIHRKYADILRHNSFRRARTTRQWLGYGFTFAIQRSKQAKEFDMAKPAQLQRWVREHGTSVIDFGAGHLTETRMLQQAGIRVSPFEPYRLKPGSDQIDPDASRETARAFLADVASGVRWSSIFISSVLNSVPFAEDRQHIVRILHALCSSSTKLYALAIGYERWKRMWNDAVHDDAQTIRFALPYEPRVSIGEFESLPKVQKFHTPEEFRDLFTPCFQQVKPDAFGIHVAAICSRPRAIDRRALRAALEFEFDLPYPDGSRLGLVDEAIAAFERRLGCTL